MAEPEPPALTLSAAQAPVTTTVAAPTTTTAAPATTTTSATKDPTPTTSTIAVSSTVPPLAPSTSVAAAAPPAQERAFCEVARRYLLRVRTLSISLSAKDRARDLLAGAPATAQLAAAAPAELRPEVVVLAEAVNTLSAKLAAADYDLSRLAPEALMTLQSPQVVRAMSAVDGWAQRTC